MTNKKVNEVVEEMTFDGQKTNLIYAGIFDIDGTRYAVGGAGDGRLVIREVDHKGNIISANVSMTEEEFRKRAMPVPSGPIAPPTLVVGDVVRLKCGGPPMVVDVIHTSPLAKRPIETIWHADDGSILREPFTREILDKVTSYESD